MEYMKKELKSVQSEWDILKVRAADAKETQNLSKMEDMLQE